jgi:hypothetical protein
MPPQSPVLHIHKHYSPLIFISCGQNAGQNHRIQTDNKSYENMAKLIYFQTTLTYFDLRKRKKLQTAENYIRRTSKFYEVIKSQRMR